MLLANEPTRFARGLEGEIVVVVFLELKGVLTKGLFYTTAQLSKT